MNEKHGLSASTINAIQGVLQNYPAVEKALLYGSRAMGTHRPGSDIDLTLVGPQLSLTTLFSIANELDDLLLPYQIDLSLWKNIENPDLRQHIAQVQQELYARRPGLGHFAKNV